MWAETLNEWNKFVASFCVGHQFLSFDIFLMKKYLQTFWMGVVGAAVVYGVVQGASGHPPQVIPDLWGDRA